MNFQMLCHNFAFFNKQCRITQLYPQYCA